MKVSKVIENLEFMLKNYGDLEVSLQIEDENENDDILLDTSIFISSDEKTIFIQNFEF
jgi:hypothetical protein